MNKIEICPICGEEMKVFTDYMEGYILMERWYDCPKNHYGYNYVTGSDYYYVGGRTFYGYSEDSVFFHLYLKLYKLFYGIKNR